MVANLKSLRDQDIRVKYNSTQFVNICEMPNTFALRLHHVFVKRQQSFFTNFAFRKRFCDYTTKNAKDSFPMDVFTSPSPWQQNGY